MTRRNKRFIILGILVLITILRETGYLELNWHKNSITSSSTSNFMNTSTSLNSSLEVSIAWTKTMNDSCNFEGQVRNIPIKVLLDNEAVIGSDIACNSFEVTIDSFYPGAIWTPLIKSGNFKIAATCSGLFALSREKNGKVVQTQYNITGDIHISGKIQVYGICSYRSARKMVEDHVVKEVYQQAKARIQNL